VRPHVRPCFQRYIDVGHAPLKISKQCFDEHFRGELAKPCDRASDMVGTAVEEIIAIDHCEDDVLQVELRKSARHVFGLAYLDRPARISRRNCAKATAARARVAQEHDRCRAFSPTLSDVWTARFFANRMKIELAKRFFEMGEALAAGRADLQPRWLG